MELNCEIIRDLLPNYVDGVASEATVQEVEAHLQRCESCRSVAELMKREAESRSDGEPQKIDYLKRVRRRNSRRVLLAAGAVLLTVLAVLFVLRYAVGERAGTDATCQIREEDGALTLLLGTSRDGRTLSTVSDSVQGDALYLEVRQTPISFLHDPCERTFRADGSYRQIYLEGRLVWQDGTAISDRALLLYGAKNPYVGDAPADEALLYAAGMEYGFTLSLQTANEPYGMTVVLGDVFRPDSPELERIQRRMQSYAVLSLALTDNLGVFSWRFQQTDGTEVTQELTRAEADALLAVLQGSGTQEPLQAHDFAAEPYLVQKLLELLEI